MDMRMMKMKKKIGRNEDGKGTLRKHESKSKSESESSFKSRKRRNDDVYKAIRYVVLKRQKKMMMMSESEQQHDRKSSSSRMGGGGEDILSENHLKQDKAKAEQQQQSTSTSTVSKHHDDDEDFGSTIKIGDTVDLSELLFTKKRDFLIKYNKHKVKAKDLSGKFVVLYFMSLTPYYDRLETVTAHLLDIYSKLQPRGDFEIVLVAIHDDVSHYFNPSRSNCAAACFFGSFSIMPWPAIPFSDLESRMRLETIFGGVPRSVIIDPTGVVLQREAEPLFLRYGAAAYPFTNERIQSIDSEDNLLLTQHPLSIQKLLVTPERDYLINNNGDQVPIADLDHKVVGLYFCPCIDNLSELYTTGHLKQLYQDLSKNTNEFEIVLIYTHGWCDCYDKKCHAGMGKHSFLNKIKTMPWLALPFEDTNCNKKLQRLFQHPQKLEDPIPAMLVTIGPHGKFVEPLATYIFRHYGAQAYPFSLQSAVNLEIEKLNELKLEMFWDPDTVFAHYNGSQIRFSQFIGKRIIVLFQNSACTSNGFWRELKARYCRLKGTDDEFEVIHIGRGINAKGKRFAAPVPWFMHPPLDQDSNARKYRDRVWPGNPNYTGLIAFDRDGSVVRMIKGPELGDNMVFPFYQDGDMESEVSLHVREYIKRKLECVNKEPDYL